MSAEQLLREETDLKSISKNFKSNSPKVDIRDLLLRIRQKEKKDKNKKYLFLVLLCCVIGFTGIIATF